MILPNLESRQVLIVEDDDMSYMYLYQLLKIPGCLLFRAKSGPEAFDIFLNNRIDMILMDIHLPDLDGTQVTHDIRMKDPSVPIIAQTAGRSIEEKIKALAAGCNEVLIKPFTMNELYDAIGRHVKAVDPS